MNKVKFDETIIWVKSQIDDIKIRLMHKNKDKVPIYMQKTNPFLN